MRSRFGVYIPLWPKDKPTGRCVTLEFVLTGLIPSKKNRQRATFNYSWAIGQVRSFFKTRTDKEIDATTAKKFLIKLLRDIKPWIYKPDEIVQWEKQAIEQLHFQSVFWKEVFAKHDLVYPITRCSISIRHYWKDEYERDNSNREQTIHDILVAGKIIADDHSKCLFRNTSEAKIFPGQLTDHITTINITAYDW